MTESPTSKKIEYPKLKKIGGFRSFFKKTLIKITIIILISSLIGGLSGYAVQKSFRDLTGYNKKEIVITETQTTEEDKSAENSESKTEANTIIRQISDKLASASASMKATNEWLENNEPIQKANETSKKILSVTSPVGTFIVNLVEAVKNNETIKKASEASLKIILGIVTPLYDSVIGLIQFLDKAVFWIPFWLIFILTAWLTNNIFYSKRYLLTNGVDPQVIENMEILEAKVKELVDNANTNNK